MEETEAEKAEQWLHWRQQQRSGKMAFELTAKEGIWNSKAGKK